MVLISTIIFYFFMKDNDEVEVESSAPSNNITTKEWIF